MNLRFCIYLVLDAHDSHCLGLKHTAQPTNDGVTIESHADVGVLELFRVFAANQRHLFDYCRLLALHLGPPVFSSEWFHCTVVHLSWPDGAAHMGQPLDVQQLRISIRSNRP